MREKLQDLKWKRPENYSWNHAGEPGSKNMELILKKAHRAVAHKGSASDTRSAIRALVVSAKGQNLFNKINCFMNFYDAANMAGFIPNGRVTYSKYYFVADDGSVFVMYEGLFLFSPKRIFIAGPKNEEIDIISKEDVLEY